jgi:hypothetical protein
MTSRLSCPCVVLHGIQQRRVVLCSEFYWPMWVCTCVHEETCPGPLPLYFYDLIAPNYSASFCAVLGLGAYLFAGFFFACYMQLPVAVFIFTVSRFLGISV